MEIEAKVTDASLAFDSPAVYEVEHESVSRVLSFTHTYSGQALEGETIEACGICEHHGDSAIPLVGERTLALAVDAVARLPRASILVLAGSIMGGEISKAVDRVREAGIPVIALKMAGTVPEHADLVVTDPIQAGVFAVMHISSKAVFDINRVRGREF